MMRHLMKRSSPSSSTLIKYQNPHFNPKAYSKHHIDRQAIEQVPSNSFVLDIGCATGFMGAYLKREKGCTVYGFDLRTAEADVAKKVLDKMIVGDIEDEKVVERILKETRGKKFDVILATSLIEHLRNPAHAVQIMKKLLKKDGKLIMTTPNIAHWTTRLMLLQGKFDYTEYGIMDNTHTHLFTAKTFQELFEDAGLEVVHFSIDSEGGGYPRASIFLAQFFPGLFAYQLLCVGSN